MTKQAIIYTRFSPRPNAKECTSIRKQWERCQAYCKEKDYVVIAHRADEAISGSTFLRPSLQAAIALLDSDKILVVDSSDRLARDMLVYVTIESQVEQAGAIIEFADGSPPGTTPEGKFFRHIMAGQAAYVRDCIRLRTKLGLEKKRKNGERTTSQIPIGWMLDPKDDKRLVVCQQERLGIIDACYLKAGGSSSIGIASELNDHHGPCRGKPWSARTVRKMIQKHSYWACPISGHPALEPLHP